MAAAAILENRKIVISRPRFHRFRPNFGTSTHKVLINLQVSNIDALKNQNYGFCWPAQSDLLSLSIQRTVYYAVFKLLPKPLKLLLSQLSKFCQNHISYTSLIIVISLNFLRCFGKYL